MTDKEIAKDYAEHNQGKYTNEFGNLYHAFLAGLKTDRPQWHNLKENPNDLPKEYDIIRKAFGIYPEEKSCHRVLNQDGCFVHRLGNTWYYIYAEDSDDDTLRANVTSWKEVILPKEEENDTAEITDEVTEDELQDSTSSLVEQLIKLSKRRK